MERNKPKEIRYDLLGAKVVENLQKDISMLIIVKQKKML